MSPSKRLGHFWRSATQSGSDGRRVPISSSRLLMASCSARTRFKIQTPTTAVTGYVLAQDAWGYGYATEALTRRGDRCHGRGRSPSCRQHVTAEILASVRVLEKCGFVRAKLPGSADFPNVSPGQGLWSACFYLKRFLNWKVQAERGVLFA